MTLAKGLKISADYKKAVGAYRTQMEEVGYVLSTFNGTDVFIHKDFLDFAKKAEMYSDFPDGAILEYV
jgi:hypothetical protein